MDFIILLFVAFLSGSLLPLGSEALFIYDMQKGYSVPVLLIVASIGNIFGAIFNYYLGLKGEEYLLSKGFLKPQSLHSAQNRFNRFGGYILLLSAAPIIGDPLTFIAGVLRYNFKLFLLFVSLSKTLRYSALVWLFLWS